MAQLKYNIQLEKLCEAMELGELSSEPKIITGGLLHKMYAIETTKGRFAVKALNPQIMSRKNVMKNKINSEKIANLLAERIPALSAIKIDGCVVQCVDAQYYMIFPWVEGVSLGADEINKEHCNIIGDILGKIHTMDLSKLNINKDEVVDEELINWNYYLQQGQKKNLSWVNCINDNIENLCLWNKQALESDKVLSMYRLLSHRDLDSKNVLWNSGKPIIIDWESAGYVNPMQELIEVLMYWSEDSKGCLDKERFIALLNGYKKVKDIKDVEWKVVLNSGYLGKLEWLQYSLKRSLGIECTDKEEQQLGTNQVFGTVDSLINYSRLLPMIEEWLDLKNIN
ncbi:phosphotransferase [Inconstantimicrobium mannanitabidum]|uniref:Membrane protein n=1 Tax=Inconstantimicrobium mannanitabidum TaxID=1604901 RepID=A0ACB5RIF7_9CLOT|nr:phosphotransferase [Clostridium sp. TW13]GKX68858.1 membrane protein [Clostridium sp. TW13]